MSVNDWMEKINAERKRIAARPPAVTTHLAAVACRCGAMVMSSPQSPIKALCSECQHEDADVGRASLRSDFAEDPLTDVLACFPSRADWEQVQIMKNADGDPVYYYQASGEEYRKQYFELVNGEEPYPQPAQTSREPMTMQPPTALLALAEYAREASWEVRMQYAQGHAPHGSTGKPGALRDSIALRFTGHPVTDRGAYAVYEKPASGKAWTWNGIMIWGPDLPPYSGCGVTELKEFLSAACPMPAPNLLAWVNVIKERRRMAAEETKFKAAERAKTAMPKGEEGMS